jgi:3-(methylthio)propanoyl-CoA dehydrogenase
MTYKAPLKDMLFAIKHIANIDEVAKIPGFEEAGFDTAQAVLEECAKFNEGVLAPLNWEGDVNPSTFKDGKVTTTPGFKEAFKQYAEGGWQGLQHPAEYGGQGLPKTIGAACGEMLNSANMSFALCPLLSDGAIEALLTAGSDELKATYLENLVSGKWTGTMNLTEPQAGSDLALVRTRAEPLADSSYKIFGTKIFITYGEHDMAENLVHLVLARVVGAPEGVKGISLFVVPKFMVNKDGSLGARNDVHCVSIEHKMGIKASPTAVLQYGDHGGAVGYIVGQENRGHVHHDERRALRRGHAGHCDCRARLPKSRAIRQRPRAKPPSGRQHCRQRSHHSPPRCKAHADDHARLYRGLPRHGCRGRRCV